MWKGSRTGWEHDALILRCFFFFFFQIKVTGTIGVVVGQLSKCEK